MPKPWTIGTLAFLVAASPARGHFLGVDMSLGTDRAVTTAVTAVAGVSEGAWLGLTTGYQRAPLDPSPGAALAESYSARLGLGYQPWETLQGELSLSAAWGDNAVPTTGIGLDLAWSLVTGGTLTTGTGITRYGGTQGGHAFQQSLTVGLHQPILDSLALRASYTYFIYADRTGYVADIPDLFYSLSDPKLMGLLAGTPYDAWSVGFIGNSGSPLSFGVTVTSVLTSLSARRIRSGEVQVTCEMPGGYSLSVRAAASTPLFPTPEYALSYRGGLTFGFSW